MNEKKDCSNRKESTFPKNDTTNRPDDPEWNWSKIYQIEISQKYLPCGSVTHLRVCRHDSQEIIGNWDVLQRIKTDVLGDDTIAIEFYPPENEIVNEVNIRHLWVFPETIIPREYLPFRPYYSQY
jgi:hypothetical protein